MSSYVFIGGGSCLQFIKSATSAKHSEVKCREMRSACKVYLLFLAALEILSLKLVLSNLVKLF